MPCHIKRFRSSDCDESPFQTLKDLDSVSCNSQLKISWLILSRLGLCYLDAPYKSWTICSIHYSELYEKWKSESSCCHPDHGDCQSIGTELVSLVMSVKLLQGEGKVLPISGKICVDCKDIHDNKYSSTPGEQVLIIVKSSNSEMTEDKDEDESSILSHDSDNDPTWSPRQRSESPDSDIDKPKKGTTETTSSTPSSLKKNKRKNSPVPSTSFSSLRKDLLKERNENESNDYRHFCKYCKISFYRLSSYIYHKKTSSEIHNRIKSKLRKKTQKEESHEEWECTDCIIAFPDAMSHQKHFAEIHFTVDHPFHCNSCNIILQSESAFKSHNSKLHLERRDKFYYCRECDETFACKVQHQKHISIHRPWNEDHKGLQCKICGKVFTANQSVAYHRHWTTHDADSDDKCNCLDCIESSTSSELPFACGLCSKYFHFPEELENHVKKDHCKAKTNNNNKRIPDLIPISLKKRKTIIHPEKINSESGDRNWAAEFGYGRNLSIIQKPEKDLLAKMKLSFQFNNEEDEEILESDNLTIYGTRGFRGNIKASLKKSPRVLSDSSRRTRKRMEALLKRARAFMRRREGYGGHCSPPSSPISEPPDSEPDEPDSSDETLIEENEGLLIPLENGWVCEKKWEDEKYTTHFWSPDGLRHSSLPVIKFYGEKKNLNLNMEIFVSAVNNNPPPPPLPSLEINCSRNSSAKVV